jgi:hypothetical protein
VTETPSKLKLLRDQPHVGDNGHGKYFLYSVQDEAGIEFAWFAPQEIHDVIQTNGLRAGSEILVKRVQANGKKGVTKVELSMLGKSAEPQSHPSSDNCKELLLQSIRDAVDIVKEAGIQFSNDELQKLATTLFIQRTRLA